MKRKTENETEERERSRTTTNMFPVNSQVLTNTYNIRSSEHYVVNHAKSEYQKSEYGKSAIQYMQRIQRRGEK